MYAREEKLEFFSFEVFFHVILGNIQNKNEIVKESGVEMKFFSFSQKNIRSICRYILSMRNRHQKNTNVLYLF